MCKTTAEERRNLPQGIPQAKSAFRGLRHQLYTVGWTSGKHLNIKHSTSTNLCKFSWRPVQTRLNFISTETMQFKQKARIGQHVSTLIGS